MEASNLPVMGKIIAADAAARKMNGTLQSLSSYLLYNSW